MAPPGYRRDPEEDEDEEETVAPVFGLPPPVFGQPLTPPKPKRTAFGATLRKNAETIEEALPLTNPHDIEAAWEYFERLPPERQERLHDKMKWGTTRLRGIQKGAAKTVGALEDEGEQEAADRLGGAIDTVAGAVRGAGEAAATGGAALLSGFDWAHRQVRRATLPGGPGRAKDPTAPTPDEWNKAVREEAAKGRLGYQALKEVGDVPGRAFGGVIGALVGGVGAASDVAAGKTPTWENFSKTVEETQRDTGDFARMMLTDPLSALGAAGGGARGTAAALGRTAAVRKLATPARAALLAEIEATAAQGLNRQSALALGNRMTRAGIPADEAHAALQQAFGRGGEFLGRAQAGVGVPLGDLWGAPFRALGARGVADALGTKIPLAPALGLPDYALGKAAKAVVDPVLKRAGAAGTGLPMGLHRGLFDPSRRFLQDEQAVARGKVATTFEEMAKDARNMMKVLPSDQGARARLVRGTVDPNYVATPQDFVGPQPAGVKTVDMDGLRYTVESAPGSIYEPYASLPKADRTAVSAMRRFFGKWGDELERAGVLEPGQRARNLLSDDYFPRITDKVFGFLDELAEKQLPRGTSALKSRAPRGGTPLGRIADAQGRLTPDTPGWYLDAKFDPADVIPSYARQASRAVGEQHLEDFVVRQFGTRTRPDQNHTMIRDGVWVPTDLYRLSRGTFDESLKTMGSALSRQAWVKETAVGRTLLWAVKKGDELSRQLKIHLTSKVPGFHFLNFANDAMQSMPYARNYASSYALGNSILRGSATATVRTPTRVLTAEQTRGLMRRHNIALEAEYEGTTPFSRLNFGDELKDIARVGGGQRPARAMTPGEVAKKAWRAYDQTPQRVGQALRARSEAALFVDRLQQGDAPEQAARVVREALLDYQDANRAFQIATWFQPFARYLWKAPVMVGRAAVRNPAAVQAFDRFMDVSTPDEGPERPAAMTERGPSYRMGERTKEVWGNAMKAISGGRVQGWPEGMEGAFLPRAPFAEAFAPFQSREQGIATFGPGMQAAMSFATGRNPITKQEVALPETWQSAVTGAIPQGMSAAVGGPFQDILEKFEVATENQIPWASQVVAPYLLSPMPMQLANEYLYRRGGGEAQGVYPRYLGNIRPYSEDPEEQFAAARLNLMTRTPGYTLSPFAAISNRIAHPKVRAGQKAIDTVKKRGKQVQMARDEE